MRHFHQIFLYLFSDQLLRSVQIRKDRFLFVCQSAVEFSLHKGALVNRKNFGMTIHHQWVGYPSTNTPWPTRNPQTRGNCKTQGLECCRFQPEIQHLSPGGLIPILVQFNKTTIQSWIWNSECEMVVHLEHVHISFIYVRRTHWWK